MEIEGTSEAQRVHDLAWGLYLKHMEGMEEPMDGQVYQPAPHIEPDTRVGFSLDGNYHAIPDIAVENRRRIAKLSHSLIQTLIQDIPDSYGSTGRADAVWFALSEIEEENGLEPMEFNDVFNLFVNNYNGGQD